MPSNMLPMSIPPMVNDLLKNILVNLSSVNSSVGRVSKTSVRSDQGFKPVLNLNISGYQIG